ncbi:MAG: stage V sporulation T C-terminal domain-containing protein [Oscillospiraceae bacterium]
MKATGIVRRIDDLGRVVIPKEIRRTMRIREGDPLEIYTDSEGEVIFKKYSPIGELGNFALQYAEVLNKTSGYPVVVCDRDHVITVAGVPKKELLERRVSPNLEELMETRKIYECKSATEIKKFQPVEGIDKYAIVAAPIIASGDVYGSIMLLSDDELSSISSEIENKLIQTAANFLGKQMEE